MIIARPQKNRVQAKAYFREHLAHGDYYSEGQKVAGVWFGQEAVRLGLDPGQPVTAQANDRLCDSLPPGTGARLTVRQRKVDHRVFHVFVVAPPRSVSVLALVVGIPGFWRRTARSEVALREMEQVGWLKPRRLVVR